MLRLSQSSIPAEGHITVCEQNGELVNVTDATLIESYYKGQIATLPSVSISSESLRRTAGVIGETAKSAFLEHKETTSQKIQAAWYSHGIIGVLAEICSEETAESVHPLLQTICQYLLVGLRWVSGMHFTLFPHLTLAHEDLISTFSQNRDWSNSPIRFLAWHPKAHKFAIALRDDTIKVYYAKNPLVPMLKHKLQKNITCMEWKPLAASLLAVGTHTAILIWNIDPSSYSTRPSAGAVQILSYGGHSPVTSLAWNPCGDDVMVASSALNTAIVVWNSSLAEYQVIQRVTTCGGVSRVLWSPDGSKVVAATPSSSFRIFETGLWTNERWSNLSGRVQCACWSPRGTVLLFALVGDPHVYSLTFADSQQTDSPSASSSSHGTVVLDLKPVDDDEEAAEEPGREPKTTNCIHSMIWDETGERVAIMFHKDDPRHHLVALFSTSEDPVFIISAKGYIRANGDADPVFITFKPNFDSGACLTVCWSDGNVTYIPMYYSASATISDQLHFKSSPQRFVDQNATLATNLGFDRTAMWSTTADESVFSNRTVS